MMDCVALITVHTACAAGGGNLIAKATVTAQQVLQVEVGFVYSVSIASFSAATFARGTPATGNVSSV